jgi:hypothetical protein
VLSSTPGATLAPARRRDTAPDVDPDSATGLYLGAVSGSVVFSNGYNITFSGGDIYTGNDVDPGDSDYLNFGGVAMRQRNSVIRFCVSGMTTG